MVEQDTTRREPTAAEVLTSLWRHQVHALRSFENQVRENQPDAIRRFRVTTRRLRSGLASAEPLLDVGAARTVRDHLRWTAGAISDGRDVQVVRVHVDGLLGDETDTGASRLHGRLVSLLDVADDENWQRALDHLNHPRYDEFTRSLERFTDLPPWLPAAALPAEEGLRPVLRTEWWRFRESIQQALADGEIRDDGRLHETRKVSRRARYVAEALVGVFGRKAKRLGTAAERVQAAIGDYRDSTLATTFLVDARQRLSLEVDEARSLSRFQDRVVARQVAQRADIEQRLLVADRKSLRGWMR